ncbi:MAG: hypothetical protein ACD_3C00086G0032 [uncultured bacterium (gcode 4)]|uniref:Uncharacterized protein n=1 Tax=uncultured bacterium (gcode 4) TaxID=1234023 RepID=K2FZ30_9BACT|nr:MAG: hypothetical protein ACD_3C00086G0032 [uncultured bacterium (gcode 4)]
MVTHNPKQIIEQLQTILSNPSKKIWFLFGAWISMKDMSWKDLIPGVDIMTDTVIKKFTKDPQRSAIEVIKTEIISDWKKFNIETLLSKISEKERAAWAEKLCWLSKHELEILRKDIEDDICKQVSIHEPASEKVNVETINHNTFAKWIKNADREFPVEIFTLNYDYLLELSLENQGIPYFDGFVGSYNAFFCPEWIEDGSPVRDWVKLWKLHWSLGWSQNEKKDIIRTSWAAWTSMIYPSFLKYDHSKKQPYLSYMDRLSYFLKQEDAVLFTCWYSFWDEHINELILTAVSRSRSSSVFVLNFWELEETDELPKIAMNNTKISVYAKRTAVIGWKFWEWKLDWEPDKNVSYNVIDFGFDEDAVMEEEWKTNTWTGKWNFWLGDFNKFTNFLSHFYSKSKYIKNDK